MHGSAVGTCDDAMIWRVDRMSELGLTHRGRDRSLATGTYGSDSSMSSMLASSTGARVNQTAHGMLVDFPRSFAGTVSP